MFIRKTKYEELKIKARQHDSLKIYTDDKIRELETQKQKLLEENSRYRDAIRQLSAAFNHEKQKQHYGSIENFMNKMTTKIKELVKQFKLD